MARLGFLAALAIVTCLGCTNLALAQCCSGYSYTAGTRTCNVPGCTELSAKTRPGDPRNGPLLNGCIQTPIACAGGVILDGTENQLGTNPSSSELIDGCVCVGSVCIGSGPATVDAAQCTRDAANECNEGTLDSCGNLITDNAFF